LSKRESKFGGFKNNCLRLKVNLVGPGRKELGNTYRRPIIFKTTRRGKTNKEKTLR